MNIFYPFIHKKKEKDEPTPLYVELIPPDPESEKEETPTEDNEPGVIIIELF